MFRQRRLQSVPCHGIDARLVELLHLCGFAQSGFRMMMAVLNFAFRTQGLPRISVSCVSVFRFGIRSRELSFGRHHEWFQTDIREYSLLILCRSLVLMVWRLLVV